MPANSSFRDLDVWQQSMTLAEEHAGKHGFLIENVSGFVVEAFEELPDTAAESG